jgi:hypothetical protein
VDYDPIADRDETQAQRLDRQLIELLTEIRVAIPGVQVLFAFLLTVPFAARFEEATDLQRAVYFTTLLSTALATTLFMFPAALHRLRFGTGDKARIVRWANRATIAGLAVLVFAMSGAILMVADVLFSTVAAAVVAGIVFVVMAAVWFAIPLSR